MIAVRHARVPAILAASFVAWLASQPLYAAKLHLVIGCITTDGTNRRSDENRWLYNGDRMQELFVENVPKAQLEITWIPPQEMTPASIIRRVKSLRNVARDDALMFYYAGHGAYDQHNRQYFWLLPSEENLYRQSLYTAMASHHPRLLVLVSDCCYAYAQVEKPPPIVGQPPTLEAAQVSPLFNALFFKTEGVVDLTSAKRDQSSYWAGDLTKGSIFGSSFRGVLAQYSQQELTWGQVVARVRKRTDEVFRTKIKSPEAVRLPNGKEVPQTTQTPYVFSPLPGPRVGIRASVVAGVTGLHVDEVAPPAKDAGIKVGDAILSVNGTPVRTEDDFYDAILEAAAKSFEIEYRDGQSGETKKVTITPT